MSIYLVLDGDREGGDQVASNRGWGDFSRWVAKLQAKDYRQLTHLTNFGWSQQLADLESQLSRALEESPPEDSDTLDVAHIALGIIRGRGLAEVVTVGDGLVRGDELDEEPLPVGNDKRSTDQPREPEELSGSGGGNSSKDDGAKASTRPIPSPGR